MIFSSDLSKNLLSKLSSSQKSTTFVGCFLDRHGFLTHHLVTFGRNWGSVDWQLFGWWPRGALAILTLAGRAHVSRSFYLHSSYCRKSKPSPSARFLVSTSGLDRTGIWITLKWGRVLFLGRYPLPYQSINRHFPLSVPKALILAQCAEFLNSWCVCPGFAPISTAPTKNSNFHSSGQIITTSVFYLNHRCKIQIHPSVSAFPKSRLCGFAGSQISRRVSNLHAFWWIPCGSIGVYS